MQLKNKIPHFKCACFWNLYKPSNFSHKNKSIFTDGRQVSFIRQAFCYLCQINNIEHGFLTNKQGWFKLQASYSYLIICHQQQIARCPHLLGPRRREKITQRYLSLISFLKGNIDFSTMCNFKLKASIWLGDKKSNLWVEK